MELDRGGIGMSHTRAYAWIAERLVGGGTVLLDGGIGSELQEVGYPPPERRGSSHAWGTLALYEAPDLVKEVHRRYVESGAEVLFTDTWLIHQCPEAEAAGLVAAPPGTWREKATLAVRLAREAIAEGGRAEECAVAFTMRTIDVPPTDGPGRSTPVDLQRVRDIAEAITRARPDLILVETMRDIAEDLSFPDYEILLETGIPVWVAYRRTVGSQCDVDGTPFGADGDRFGRAAARFEAIGIGAVLVNCLPPPRIAGVARWLRGFTRLPLGAYANIGQWRDRQWWWEGAPSPAEYAQTALGWIDEGMQIVGGCCGVRPAHISALKAALTGRASRAG
jgi:S-methylmethionine-dependent homocysteine/selenocysteine methylase